MTFSKSKEARLEQLLPIIEEQLRNGQSVRFTTNGTSMMPMLRDGRDQVLLSPLPERLKKYDLPLYRRESGQFVLHRIVAVGETYTCVGDNQFDLERGLRHEQMIGVVTEFTRKGKTYSVNDLSYRLYCRFWHYSRFPRRVFRAIKRRLRP